MRRALNFQRSGLFCFLVIILFFASINTYAAQKGIQRNTGRVQNIECQTRSGAKVPIIDKRMEAPILIIPGETPEQKIIAYDSWRFADVPRYILHFEQARKCIEISTEQTPTDMSDHASSSADRTASDSDLTTEELDCLAISLMRDQGLITSQELQEISQFYARWGDIEKTQRGDPRRGRNISGCFRYYKQYQMITPPKGVIIK